MPKLNGYPLALYGILETQDKLRKEIQRVTAEHHGGDLGYDIECPSEYSLHPCGTSRNIVLVRVHSSDVTWYVAAHLEGTPVSK